MHRTTLMISDDLKKRAAQKAREMNISLGEFLRTAAEDFLAREQRRWTDDPLAKDEYLISAPAPSFVSENVDHFLYGKKRK